MNLLELILATVLSAAVVLSVAGMTSPYLGEFEDILNWEKKREAVFHATETVRLDIAGALDSAVNGGQCYSLCLIDGQTGQRILYYWTHSQLKRKVENATATVSCTGGSMVTEALNPLQSVFGMFNELIGFKTESASSGATVFRSRVDIFPQLKDIQSKYQSTFGCGVASGWSFTSSTETHWSLNHDDIYGYTLEAERDSGGASVQLGTAALNVDLQRFQDPHLKFAYKNEGNIKSGDLLRIEVFNGTDWIAVFSDTVADNIELREVVVPLTVPNWQLTTQIRFSAGLTKNPAFWMVRNVEIFSL